MPSGKVHDKITLVTAAAAVPVWYLYCPSADVTPLILTLGAYIFSGLWLSDDLDTQSVAYKRWGALRFLWWPYKTLVPHRSWVSHGIAVGPLIRVAYFLFMLWATIRCILWLLVRKGIPVDRNAIMTDVWSHTLTWTFAHPTWTLWIVVGLILGGVAHSVADIVVSFVKRVW
ncbi:MAG: metal-binding protein [Capsulimonas sp.]|uniref:metal-binding protein n=1 Tax=Capsulimonas sp. TaxID=2494211 RepID=UPI0032634A3A